MIGLSHLQSRFVGLRGRTIHVECYSKPPATVLDSSLLSSTCTNSAQDPEKALIEVGPSLLSFEVPSN